MDYTLDGEARMLADSVTRFVAGYGEGAQDDAALWAVFAELGWLGVPHDEALGGFGFGPVGSLILMERLGTGLVPAPYASCVVAAGGALARCPGGGERLAPLLEGSLRIASAFAEEGAHDALETPRTTAVRASGGYRLTGAKMHVLGAGGADALLVPARIDGSAEVGLFLVPIDAAGLAMMRYDLPDGRAGARVTLEEAVVPGDARIDAGTDVRAILRAVRDETLVAVAAENLGAMQALFDQTLDYAKTRKQFGRALGSFQELQFRLVDMWIKLDEARSLISTAAMALKERRADASALVAAAWIQGIWSGRAIGEEAIQIHGAIGMTEECAVGRYVKRLLVNELLFGGVEPHLVRYRAQVTH